MSQESKDAKLVFEDPRLRLSGVGRFLVRVASWITLFLLTGVAIMFVLSGIESLGALGGFFFLFLIDRLWHSKEGDRPIREFPKEGDVNVAKCVTPLAFGTLERAFERSNLKQANIYLEVLEDLVHIKEIEVGFERLEVNLGELKKRLGSALQRGLEKESREERRQKLEKLVLIAFARAREVHHDFIESTDLFVALLTVEDGEINKLFAIFSLDSFKVRGAILFGELAREVRRVRAPVSLGEFGKIMGRGLRHRVMNRAWTARPTPTLDTYGTDFTDLARAGAVGFLVGHAEELERLIDVLARPLNPNALLIGEAGVGKETLIAHFALRLVKDDVPAALFDKRLVGLNIGELVAGAPPEELHARLQKVVSEIVESDNIILYIPDLHNLLKTSSGAFLSVADALTPIFLNNAFPVIGATYPREYKSSIEPRSDFAGAFEVIRVEEISPTEALTVLIYDAVLLERQFKVKVTLGALQSAVTLSKKFLQGKLLPGGAEELLKSAMAGVEKRSERILRHEDIARALEARVKVPVHEAEGEEAEELLHLEEIIHGYLIDQEEAVKAVSDALREYRSGLARKGGPIATFLFVGPTGVGKTELAKTLARVHFGSESLMVRFDMTEYQDVGSLQRFIGSPDGSKGGALTDAVLEHPYGVVLLDEFEKAHQDILNLFLQVFDDGRLTDSLGRTVNFDNTILIATSNAHSDIINDSLREGKAMQEIAEYLKSRLTDVFKPELVNRFSRIVVFKNLSPEDLTKIAGLQLKELGKTLAEQGIVFEPDPSAIALLVKLGYEPAFGARPLRRVLEEKIRAPLAEKILKKEIMRGGTFTLTAKGESFEFVGRES